MRGRVSSLGVKILLATALTAAMTLVGVTGAGASGAIDLTTKAGINSYLTSIGVDPATAVWQQSLLNYAGPSCPGAAWNCVPANAPIVQVALPGGTNLFSCPAARCVNVQVITNDGSNASACNRTETDGEAIQSCDITQAGTKQTNAATISQSLQQTQGSTQKARQIARITQTNETGSNTARIIQRIGQSSRLSGDSPTQTQEAHQAGTVTQTTESVDPDAALGDNSSNISQTQDQLEKASGGGGPLDTVMQKQNTDTTGNDQTCDQPGDPTFDQAKNQCVQVIQHSGVLSLPPSLVLAPGGGDNSSTLFHGSTQRQFADSAGFVNQSQGAFAVGQQGTKEQLSSGVSTSNADQNTVQDQTAPLSGLSGPLVTQSQSTGDPRCCQLQADNPGDSANITQTTNQSASEGDNALQGYFLASHCSTTGTCHVMQSATVNGGEPDTFECNDTDPPSLGECDNVTAND